MATIKEIKERLASVTDPSDPIWRELANDDRVGVQKAVEQRQKALAAEQAEEIRLEQMLSYERHYYDKGYELIAGVDEVGRGPLAGPVVAAAVILPKNCKIKGLNDSKKIPKHRHKDIYEAVMRQAIAVEVSVKDEVIIDQVNIYEATKLAMSAAIEALEPRPEALFIDAMTLDKDIPQESIIKGDANSLSIAAASIVAKVTRDRIMEIYDGIYPGYAFTKHAGYATAEHIEALRELGPSPIHRKTFEPIKSML